MATRNDTQPATETRELAQQAERELHIEMWLDEHVQFEGTAAQLQAEGLIPDGIEWPRGAGDLRWEANGFTYWLRRTRPVGHKGPMRSWLVMDNWFVRIEVTGRDYGWRTRRYLERKAEELRAEYHHYTAAGSAEWHAKCDRYWATVDDRKFQAFKALIPGLVPPKRGRKAAGAAR
jgi:hypothetical protein